MASVQEVDQAQAKLKKPISPRVQCVMSIIDAELEKFWKEQTPEKSLENTKKAIFDSIQGAVMKLIPKGELSKDIHVSVDPRDDKQLAVNITYPNDPKYQKLTNALVESGLHPVMLASTAKGPVDRNKQMVEVHGQNGRTYHAFLNRIRPYIIGVDVSDSELSFETTYVIALMGKIEMFRKTDDRKHTNVIVSKAEYDRLVKIYNEFHNYKPDNLHQLLKK